jgi:phosphoglucosamine mutase
VVVRASHPDGHNINEGCGVFHIEELGSTVQQCGAILGFALDGDADRALLVDDRGTVRDGDHILGLLAANLHEKGKLAKDTLVTTVMANLGLKDYLKQRGIHCEMTPVGDRHVAEAMDRTGAILGGEQSGHIIFREGDAWFGDGLYSALRVLEVMDSKQIGLHELCAGIEKYPQKLINVAVARKLPLDSVTALTEAKSKAEKQLGEEGRVLLRYSGTESLLRVMVEGKNIEEVEALAKELARVARESLV